MTAYVGQDVLWLLMAGWGSHLFLFASDTFLLPPKESLFTNIALILTRYAKLLFLLATHILEPYIAYTVSTRGGG